MTQDIRIREAGAGEWAEVEALVEGAYREFRPLMPDGVWERWMDNLKEIIHAPEGVLLVASSRGRLEGAVKFYPDARQARQGQWPAGAASIRMLAVRPGSRGKGYGLRLTQACLHRAQELAIPTIFLYTGTFMAAARRSMKNWGLSGPRNLTGTPAPSPTAWNSSERQFCLP
jgi:GNAT superfamily N-acetyltransferase